MSVRFALYVFDVYVDVFDGRYVYQGNMLDWVKKFNKSIEENFMIKSAKQFSVLPCYFMKQEDTLGKRWIVKLTLNFGGELSDTASTFLKVASADEYFLYEDGFDAVITITDCQIWYVKMI